MREVGDCLLAARYDEITDVGALIDAVRSPRISAWRQRAVAAEALRFIDLDAGQAQRVEQQLSAIVLRKDISAISRLSQRGTNAGTRFGILAICTLCIVQGVLGVDSLYSWIDTNVIVFMSASAGTALVIAAGLATVLAPLISPLVDMRREERLREAALQTLGRWGGSASVEALAAAAGLNMGLGMGAFALPSLRSVLNRLDPGDYGAVPPEGIRRLCDLLTDSDSSGFGYLGADVPLILDSLGQVAGGNAVPTVQKVTESGRMSDWRARAAEVLPVLLERRRREQESARLLRATESPDTSDSLLRPAVGATQPAELLLRPTTDDSTT
jgi:hypothetical protein